MSSENDEQVDPGDIPGSLERRVVSVAVIPLSGFVAASVMLEICSLVGASKTIYSILVPLAFTVVSIWCAWLLRYEFQTDDEDEEDDETDEETPK